MDAKTYLVWAAIGTLVAAIVGYFFGWWGFGITELIFLVSPFSGGGGGSSCSGGDDCEYFQEDDHG